MYVLISGCKNAAKSISQLLLAVEFLVLQLLLRRADTWIKRGSTVATEKEEVHRYERHLHFHADVRTPLIVTESQACADNLLWQGTAQIDPLAGQTAR